MKRGMEGGRVMFLGKCSGTRSGRRGEEEEQTSIGVGGKYGKV